MQRNTLAILRFSFAVWLRAGTLRLVLLYYATIVAAFPATVLLFAVINHVNASALFRLWAELAVALLLAPVAMFVPAWLIVTVWLFFAPRRSAAA